FSSTTSKLEIGSLTNQYYLEGGLDEVAIHNVELSPAEILQHYTNGLQGVDYFASPTLAKSANITISLLETVDESTKLIAYAVRNTEIRIKGSVNSGTVATLYDMVGRVIQTKILEEGSINRLLTPGIKSAIYVLSVNDHGKIQTFKIPVRE
ncbi:MAG TPA: T9SS type A sorting domain-containing protein, partial [Prolixibacteraceae bacterium]